MNVAIESPPPHTKRTLSENNCCAGDIDVQEVLNSNKRRLVDSLGAGVRGVGGYPELGAGQGFAQHEFACSSGHNPCHQYNIALGSDLSPSENLHVNSRSGLHPSAPTSKRTRYHEEAVFFHQQQQQQQLSHQNYQSQQSRNSNVQETLFKALRALFPNMRDETIAHVLETCGEDVDAAIRRLNELKLEGGDGHIDQDGKVGQGAGDDGKVVQGSDKAADRASKANIEIKSAWVEALVSEMSQARDVEDAKRRAAVVLQGVLEDHEQGCASDRVASANLQKENALLKRAVGIQNNKIHELGEKCKGVDELAAKFEEVKGRCQALEMHNYSLQVHLKEATSQWQPSGNEETGGRNPDVY